MCSSDLCGCFCICVRGDNSKPHIYICICICYGVFMQACPATNRSSFSSTTDAGGDGGGILAITRANDSRVDVDVRVGSGSA